jgi:hypothetical protein
MLAFWGDICDKVPLVLSGVVSPFINQNLEYLDLLLSLQTAGSLCLFTRPSHIAPARTAQKTSPPTDIPLLLADSLPSDGSGIVTC